MLNDKVRSVVRALDILELLAQVPTAMGVSELARRVSTPKSTALLLVSTLVARGYVARTAEGLYLLNPVFTGHWIGGGVPQLAAIARPVMTALVERCGETAYFGVLTAEWRVRYVLKVVSPQDVRYDSDIAAPRVPYNISAGRVLLAYQSLVDVERYLRRAIREPEARRVIGTVRGFVQQLARVRGAGYAINSDTRIIGASGVSAPIFGADGRVVAALNVTAPTARFPSVRTLIRDSVVGSAAEISRVLSLPTVRTMSSAGDNMKQATRTTTNEVTKRRA